MRQLWKAPLAALLLLLAAAAAPALAQQQVPAELQATIVARVIAYDRSFRAGEGRPRVGVLFKASDKSADSAPELVDAFEAVGSLSAVSRRYKDLADLSGWMSSQKIRILYVAPGLAEEVEAVRDLARQRKTVTVTPVRAFVERGLAIGIVPRGGRAGILVNREAAVAAGMDLDPKLLGLAEVLR